MKALLILGGIGLACLTIATAWLAILNWSSRLYVPIVTGAVVGIATALVSLVSTLKETETRDVFITSVVINADGSPAMVTSDEPDLDSRFGGIGMLLAAKLQLNPQQNATDIFGDALEAEQYYVARLLSDIQRGGWVVSRVGSTVAGAIRPDSPLQSSVSFNREQLSELFAGSVFPSLPSEQIRWMTPSFKVPPGTTIAAFHIPTSPATGAEKRGIRLQKANYFTYEILFEPLTSTEGIPARVSLLGTQRVPTVVFIRVEVTRARLKNGRFPK